MAEAQADLVGNTREGGHPLPHHHHRQPPHETPFNPHVPVPFLHPPRQKTHSDSEDDGDASDDQAVGATRLRILVLFVFVMYGVSNQFQFTLFTNVYKETAMFFGTGSSEVNVLFLVFGLVYLLGCLPSCDVIRKIGLRRALLFGTGANAAGAVLKCVAALWLPNYAMLVVAQFGCALAQLFLMGTPPLMAAVWFPAQERALATGVGTLSAFLGMSLGFLIPPLVVPPLVPAVPPSSANTTTTTTKPSPRPAAAFEMLLLERSSEANGTTTVAPSAAAMALDPETTKAFVVIFVVVTVISIAVVVAFALLPEEPSMLASHTSPAGRRLQERKRQQRRERVNNNSGDGSTNSMAPPLPPTLTATAAVVSTEHAALLQYQVDGGASSSAFDDALRDAARHQVSSARQAFRLFKSNPNFRATVIGVGGITGALTAVAGVLAQLVKPYNVTEQQTGWMTSIGILLGSFNCVLVGGLVDEFRKYRQTLLVLMSIVCVCFVAEVAFCFSLAGGSADTAAENTIALYAFGAILCVACVSLLPTIPVGMELSVEVTYDPALDEALPATTIMWMNAAAQVVGIVIFTFVLGDVPTAWETRGIMLGITLVMFTLTLVIYFFAKEDLRRMRVEAEATARAQQRKDNNNEAKNEK